MPKHMWRDSSLGEKVMFSIVEEGVIWSLLSIVGVVEVFIVVQVENGLDTLNMETLCCNEA